MRYGGILAATLTMPLLAAGCSKSEQAAQAPSPGGSSGRSAEALTADSAPDVGVTAAPGVAFNYRYAFRLPANRIGAVQEQHAQACEQLGIARCRITGLLYRLVSDHDVEAMLAFKLDPALARAFGKAGVVQVGAAEGMLIESEVTGEDAGQAIDDAGSRERDLAQELNNLQRQFAGMSAKDSGRTALLDQIARLREAIRASSTGKAANRAALASTPVVFNYGSGRLVPGFDDRSPILSALDQAGGNIVGGIGVMIVLLGTLLPWVVLVAAAIVLVRLARPRVSAWFSHPPES